MEVGGCSYPPHEGKGFEKNLIYIRKPWLVFKKKKSADSQLDPRTYSREEMATLFECMDPYEKLLFIALYNTGGRSEELIKLLLDRIEFDDADKSVRIVLKKTKNHKPRNVALNP